MARERVGERHDPVELDGQPCANDDTGGREAPPKVRGADRQRSRRAAGARDAAEGRAGRPVVPRRCDDEGVQPHCAGRGARDGAVGEAAERLRECDQGNARRVVRVAVAVGIDCAVQPREHLVGSPIDCPVGRRVALPAGDADRQDRSARRDARHTAGSAGADDETRHFSAVTLEVGRRVGVRGRDGAR